MSKHLSKSLGKKKGRKPASEETRKSRVIQTRVPEDLESTLKDAAEQKRMTVSHLIRHVLEDTFSLVDGIVSDSSTLVENVARDAKRIAATARGELDDDSEGSLLDQVDAWQDVIVNKAGTCAECKTELKRGKHAFRGLTNSENKQAIWLCQTCIENL